MECWGRDVNRMVCGGEVMWGGRLGCRWVWLGLVGLSLVGLGLGDCVWCVLLPEIVANATASSKSTPPVSHD